MIHFQMKLYRMATCSPMFVLLICVVLINCVRGNSARPNIVFFMADDLGWDDIGYHGSDQVVTPNIDMLAYTGVALERYYTHCVCTPSRAALLTGKFSHKTGMQGYPLTNGEDRGIPVTEKLLPEYLKESGYSTHLIGKWHVGKSRTEFLPTSRGFDSHFGFQGGFIDYYEYWSEETWSLGRVSGLDLYRNLTPAWDVKGYITDVFTDEAKDIIKSHDDSKPLFLMMSYSAPHAGNDGAILQAPPETVRDMRHVESPNRRIYAAMIKKLDDSVGEIFKALYEKQILDNTIIVFVSDNGGMTLGKSINFGSNWPLRGLKFTPYEGGIRTAGLIWTPALATANHLWKGYMHVVDWLPTLLRATGTEPPANIDGIDLWNEILLNQTSNRQEFFEFFTFGNASFSLMVSGEFKLIVGNPTREYSEHLGGEFRGIIGEGPSYTKVIKKSDVYKVLDMKGMPFKMDGIALRNNLRVQCKATEFQENSCYAENGTIRLFNIKEDPCEIRDLINTHPDVAARMLRSLHDEMSRIIDRPYPGFRDPRALPKLFNYTWAAWADHISESG